MARGIASFPTRQGLMDALPRILQTREEPNADQFRGGHWDEPNVLAHLRLSDRTVGGKRTLLVEELQSDWAQKGMREGFQEPIDQSKFPTYEQWLEAEITPEARKDEAVNRRVYENDKSDG